MLSAMNKPNTEIKRWGMVVIQSLYPNRNISSLVDNQLEQLNIPITDSTQSIMAYYIKQLLENLHNRFYNYYNFKDLY